MPDAPKTGTFIWSAHELFEVTRVTEKMVFVEQHPKTVQVNLAKPVGMPPRGTTAPYFLRDDFDAKRIGAEMRAKTIVQARDCVTRAAKIANAFHVEIRGAEAVLKSLVVRQRTEFVRALRR